MSAGRLEVNHLVQIRALEGEIRESHPSRVEDLSDDQIALAWPSEKGQLIPFSDGQTLLVSFALDEKYYTFEATVRATKLTPVPVILLQPHSEPRRLERRADVRVRVSVSLELSEKVVSLAGFRDQGGHGSIHTQTEGLSGGGFSIRHPSFIPVGTLFEAQIILPDRRETLLVSAKVVRCDPAAEPDRDDFDVGFAFVHIPESIRSRIVRFVFAYQINELHAAD